MLRSAQYDLALIINPQISDTELPAVIETLRSELKSHGAEDMQEDMRGKQKLNFLVKGNRFGYFLNFKFQMLSDKPALLKKKLDLQTEILRSMISQAKPSHMTTPQHVSKRHSKTMPASVMAPAGTFQSASAPSLAPAATEIPVETLAAQSASLTPVAPSAPAKVDLADLDRRIDELLNKETF